jgi:hypothetical protein
MFFARFYTFFERFRLAHLTQSPHLNTPTPNFRPKIGIASKITSKFFSKNPVFQKILLCEKVCVVSIFC